MINLAIINKKEHTRYLEEYVSCNHLNSILHMNIASKIMKLAKSEMNVK